MKKQVFLSTLDFNVPDELKEAAASISSNPAFGRPITFIFTDAFANANKQRIPEAEFKNVIKTGANMPMKLGLIKDDLLPEGHEGALPLGVITHLVKAGTTVKGLGLLWKEERPEEVEFIKEHYDKGDPINLSWEIGYTDSSVDQDGVEDLLGVVVKAITFVGLPAYEGRTPVLAVASQKRLEENVDKLEQELQDLKNSVSEKDTLLQERDKEISELKVKLTELETQNQALAEYKDNAEATILRNQKITDIKTKFQEAGLEKDEDYFDKKIETLLAFDSDELEFFVQEMVSMGTASASTQQEDEDDEKVEIPNITDKRKTKVDPKELGRQLREQGI